MDDPRNTHSLLLVGFCDDPTFPESMGADIRDLPERTPGQFLHATGQFLHATQPEHIHLGKCEFRRCPIQHYSSCWSRYQRRVCWRRDSNTRELDDLHAEWCAWTDGQS